MSAIWISKAGHPEEENIERIWEIRSDTGEVIGHKIRYKTPPPQEPKEESLREILTRIEGKLDALIP